MAKAIIGGKRYDTDKADLVHEWSNGMSYSDFKHCEEELYRTPRGKWFIVGSGGPMSPYAKSTGQNSWSGSSGNIRPLTDDEALEWLEMHSGTDAIETYFSENIEDA